MRGTRFRNTEKRKYPQKSEGSIACKTGNTIAILQTESTLFMQRPGEGPWHQLSHENIKKSRRGFALQESQCSIFHLYYNLWIKGISEIDIQY